MIAETQQLKVRTFGLEDEVSRDIHEDIARQSMEQLLDRQLKAYQKMATDFVLVSEPEIHVLQTSILGYSVAGYFRFASSQMDFWEDFWRKHFAHEIEQKMYSVKEKEISADEALSDILRFVKGGE